MPPRSQTILCLCEAHQISTVPLPHIAFQSLCVPSIALPSLYFATQLQVMPSLRFAAQCCCRSMPVLAARSHASPSRHYAVHRLSVAPLRLSRLLLCTRSLSMPLRCASQPGYSVPLLRHSMACYALALPSRPRFAFAARSYRRFALAFTRALRRRTVPFRSSATGQCL